LGVAALASVHFQKKSNQASEMTRRDQRDPSNEGTNNKKGGGDMGRGRTFTSTNSSQKYGIRIRPNQLAWKPTSKRDWQRGKKRRKRKRFIENCRERKRMVRRVNHSPGFRHG